MKKLSILMFAILILGCGTETTVVEEPVVEEPEPIEPPPVVMQDEPVIPEIFLFPILHSSVSDGEVDVDPEPLNRDGFIFHFGRELQMYAAEIQDNQGAPLSWKPLDIVNVRNWDRRNRVQITPIPVSQLLEYDTEYTIVIYTQGLLCNGAETVIRFRTKPKP